MLILDILTLSPFTNLRVGTNRLIDISLTCLDETLRIGEGEPILI